MATLFAATPPGQLPSVNGFDEDGLLQGLTVLTNVTPDDALALGRPTRFDRMVIEPNADQSFVIALGINRARREAGGYFRDLGSIFATPELSVASPYLNFSLRQVKYGIPDEAYESLPAQLLSRLRADPSLEIEVSMRMVALKVFGLSAQSYEIETSADLVHWLPVGDYPVPSSFQDALELLRSVPSLFYRVKAPP